MKNARNLVFCFSFLLVILAIFSSCDAQSYLTPRDCPPNETYLECGGSCQDECATLGEPCLIRHIRCPDGCYCNEGYARDANSKCIPIAECRK